MGLREGYKQTEVGLIPESWKVATILGLSRQIMDYRGRTPKKLGLDWGGGEIPALSAGNVKMGFIDFTAECYLGSLELYRRWMTRGDIRKSDILFTTEAPLGNVALVPDSQKYILSQRTILIQVDEAQALSSFVFQQLSSGRFQRNLFDNASGSTAQGIQRKKLEQLFVVLPPLHEQRAIAEALSDVDALLSGLDRLIAKKRDLKQAAMQQLLTGQTRLPGFHGEWEVKRLGEFVQIQKGQLITSKTLRPGSIPVIAGGKQPAYFHDCANRTRRTVTISASGASAGYTAIHDGPIFASDCSTISEAESYSLDFVFYQLQHKQQAIYKAQTGGAQPHIHPKDLKPILIAVPPPAEQTAIARVLSDIDAELAALETRREKTRQLKQGMMQELLTGRTRLV